MYPNILLKGWRNWHLSGLRIFVSLDICWHENTIPLHKTDLPYLASLILLDLNKIKTILFSMTLIVSLWQLCRILQLFQNLKFLYHYLFKVDTLSFIIEYPSRTMWWHWLFSLLRSKVVIVVCLFTLKCLAFHVIWSYFSWPLLCLLALFA